MTDVTDVVYIAGDGRSGSTLLSRVLGQLPGWFSAGEIRYVWQRGLVENRPCECGRPFSECPFWTEVVSKLESDPSVSVPPAPTMADNEQHLLRTRQAWRALRVADDPAAWRAQDPEYSSTVSALYRAIQSTAGCSVIVDASKLPAYALVLRGDPQIRLHVVHLVRDPRAATHSWRRIKPLEASAPRTHMQRRSLARSCAAWSSSNELAERLLHRADSSYVRVRYEDLVTDPGPTLENLLQTLGFNVAAPVVEGGRVHVERGHAAAGNPNRAESGDITLRLDDAWRSEMPSVEQRLVRHLTRPLSTRYGYVT